MTYKESVKTVFSKYFDFSGRARRSEYWFFFLFLFMTGLGFVGLGRITEGSPIVTTLHLLWGLFTLIPGISAAARRLHDTGRSGWLQLLYPTIIGGIVVVVFLILDGHRGENEYGPNPKEVAEAA